MSESPEAGRRGASGKPRGGILTWALWGAALLGVAAVVYIIAQASTKPAPQGPSPATGSAFAEKVSTPSQPTPAPDYVFYDSTGKPLKIADFKGKVVVMNIWATWCAPCVTEMPTLAKLQAAYAGKPVEVVAVSIDSESSATKASLFIAQHAPHKFYHDREMKLPFKLVPPAPGAPTTVIYGKDGLETARVAGEADWSGPEARALVDQALAAD
jgi:thiol-disulfide isomerase/thioredoxin